MRFRTPGLAHRYVAVNDPFVEDCVSHLLFGGSLESDQTDTGCSELGFRNSGLEKQYVQGIVNLERLIPATYG